MTHPTFSTRALRLNARAADVAAVAPALEMLALRRETDAEAVVAVAAAAVNPSDAKAAIGMMPYARFPRTPGRDFAGTVVDGPAEWLGAEVFGSSGDLGIRGDGTHATHLIVEAAALLRRPANITADEAAGIGVPFVTAMAGFSRAGLPKPGETVLILGVNGKVGQAAAQIASWHGARVIGVVRRAEPYAGHAARAVEIIDASAQDVAARVRELTQGKGCDIVYNTVGEPYYAAGTSALAAAGRQIFIAAFKDTVSFDLFAFYRGRHTYVGIDTLALGSVATGAILRDLVDGFATGALKPFPIQAVARYALEDAAAAYRAVMGSARDRIVLVPGRSTEGRP